MSRYPFLSSILVAAVWCGAAQAVPQAFVQSDGSDANTRHNCTVLKPCRTFAAALTIVDDGGEIVARDSEDYGNVVITKSVTLIGNPGAGIIATLPGSVGVSIATPGIDVVLRGLNIDGTGDGLTGVSMTSGRSLSIENCVISGLGHGLLVKTAANVRVVDSVLRGNANGARIQGGAMVDIVKSRFLGNSGAGLLLVADTPGTTSVAVSDSTSSGNLVGFDAGADSAGAVGRMVVTRSMASNNRQAGFLASASAGSAFLTVSDSTAARNAIGFAHFPGVAGIATFETLGNNTVRQNDTAFVGLIVPVPPM